MKIMIRIIVHWIEVKFLVKQPTDYIFQFCLRIFSLLFSCLQHSLLGCCMPSLRSHLDSVYDSEDTNDVLVNTSSSNLGFNPYFLKTLTSHDDQSDERRRAKLSKLNTVLQSP